MAREKSDNLEPRPAPKGGEARSTLVERPPIVVVMGHVDHGKTTLLDYIRKTNIAGREAGGITQSIGAYEITHAQINADGTQTNAENQRESALSPRESVRKITFIDTPGHEAFSKMRARGAKVADLAILVVAADDGVKPQTKEVIEVFKQTNTPFVVAINKIDKSNADVERAKQELMQAGVLLEGFGGNVSWQAISAKTGQGVDELLDLILLAAELEELSYDPESPASGVIIESKMDSRRGIIAMAIVKNGILRVGDGIKTPTASGKIRNLENFLGTSVKELTPSSPALILGFTSLPQVGEEFGVGKIEEDIAEPQTTILELKESLPETSGAGMPESPILPVYLKADVSGSLEALSEIIKTLPDVKIIDESIGDITDGDVKSAFSTGALIVGFKVRVSRAAENLARSQSTEIITSDIIYELLKNLETKIQAIRTPAPLGELTTLKTFSQKGRRQVIGGRVTSGIIKTSSAVEILRGEEKLGFAKIINLQKGKQDANQALQNEECGIMLESDVTVAVGDRLIYHQTK